jgi:formate dehydrogenase major subunit
MDNINIDNNIMTVNGKNIPFEPGMTILEAARENGIGIPTLCHLKDLTPTGSCRICVVEVEGMKNLPASCCTPASGGMVVHTESPKVKKARKMVLELMLASGKHDCISTVSHDCTSGRDSNKSNSYRDDIGRGSDCPGVNDDCTLKRLAEKYNADPNRFSYSERADIPVENDNPMIVRDMSKCILCGRCVQACNEIQVNRAIGFGFRGIKSRVIVGINKTLSDSNCVFCGECVQVCPVGALKEKKSLNEIKASGKKTKIRSTCPYCGVGCQIWLHVMDGRIFRVTGVEDSEPNRGRLCVKGRFGYDFIYSDERLKTPLIREKRSSSHDEYSGSGSDHFFREASWDEALDLVAHRFKEIIAEHGADSVAGVSCSRSINEDSYQMQKLFRAVFGTNNIDNCART